MSKKRRPLFKHKQIIRFSRLLHMHYTPAELAEEISVSDDTVYRSYIPAGCPHTRDEQDRIWIVGTEFCEWAEHLIMEKKRRKTTRMAEDEAWCFRCNQITKIQSPTPKRVNLYLELLQGTCTQCSGKVNRARKASQTTSLEEQSHD